MGSVSIKVVGATSSSLSPRSLVLVRDFTLRNLENFRYHPSTILRFHGGSMFTTRVTVVGCKGTSTQKTSNSDPHCFACLLTLLTEKRRPIPRRDKATAFSPGITAAQIGVGYVFQSFVRAPFSRMPPGHRIRRLCYPPHVPGFTRFHSGVVSGMSHSILNGRGSVERHVLLLAMNKSLPSALVSCPE